MPKTAPKSEMTLCKRWCLINVEWPLHVFLWAFLAQTLNDYCEYRILDD